MNPIEDKHDHVALAKATLPTAPAGEPVFHAPWQARIFALMVSIVKDRYIPWTSFQSRLVMEIEKCKVQIQAEASSTVELTHFNYWLDAAERTLIDEGFIIDGDVERKLLEIKAAVDQVRRNQIENVHS